MAISQAVKDKAIALRLQGNTYKEISSTLDISVDWCKRNLNTVGKQKGDWIAEAVSLATRPTGCTISELLYVLHRNKEHIPVREARQLCMDTNINCLFRPDWMSADRPEESVQLMYTMADEIFNCVTDRIDYLLELYPTLDRKRLQVDLLRLSGILQNKNFGEFEAITLTLENIQARLKQ